MDVWGEEKSGELTG